MHKRHTKEKKKNIKHHWIFPNFFYRNPIRLAFYIRLAHKV